MEQIRAEGLTLGYGCKEVVKGVDLTIRKGEFLSIIGPSGVGKSTLLMGINATTSIMGGSLKVLGKDVGSIRHNDLKALRARLGVIFQGFNLVSRLSVLDNIASGMLHRKPLLSALFKHYTHLQYEELYEYMKVVGIENEALSRCDRLSGGQKQRVAIARAIAQHPEVILADEPISSLDPVSARTVLETLKNANERYGITVIANLHQLDYAREFCSRVVGLNAGRIVYDGHPSKLCQSTVAEIYACPTAKAQQERKVHHFPFSPAAASAV
ncbi:MAG: phosphonate ABC transporter ATP-binding protein [Oryzomonas sp.]|uniref:phosphonate ABC transporter ATP-binding protein n=1 Tax=Oryzomonas sp. TaxID=2855186 RepID=UPI002849CC88|nr:phosphonate ABC transporter ATP-binding protein [Oryzomonas sp.]MDR3581259.1 phosphonate ABC transporter ATP-binding protein [Oryzomonas sp.]